MHATPIGQRYKVVLEDHNAGTVTRKEFCLDDFQNLMNSRAGTTGKFIYEAAVPVTDKFSPFMTLPKGAKLLSASFHMHQPVGDTLSFGTEKEPAKIGSSKTDESFEKSGLSGSELEEPETIGFTLKGADSGQVHAVITYEKFNEWPEALPHPDHTEATTKAKKPHPQGAAAPGGTKVPATTGS